MSSTDTSAGKNGSANNACGDEQFVLLVSEDELRVVGLPSKKAYFSHMVDLSLVKAVESPIRGSPTLFALSLIGNIQVYSLPSLRLLIDLPLLGHSIHLDDRYIFSFRNYREVT